MTTKQADRLIKSGAPVTVRSYEQTFSIVLVSRDRWNVITKDGGKFDRSNLEVVD